MVYTLVLVLRVFDTLSRNSGIYGFFHRTTHMEAVRCPLHDTLVFTRAGVMIKVLIFPSSLHSALLMSAHNLKQQSYCIP